jgi:hypothetical protein
MIPKRISVLEAYSDYKKKYNKKHKLYLSKRKFNRIVKKLNEELAYELITSGKEILLPSRLGSLQIVRYLQTNKKIDFYKTKLIYKEYNKNNPNNKKVVYHTNRATKGYVPKIYWSKAVHANFRNKNKYSFIFTRPNMRPNKNNKDNPRISMIPFFKEKGFMLYDIYNPFLKKERYEQLLKKHKNSSAKSGSS